MDCNEYISRRVKLGYVADAPTSVQLVDSIGNQVFDMLPVIQAGETITSMALLPDIRRIRYYPEEYTRTEGKQGVYCDICISEIAALIKLNDLEDVVSTTPGTGETIMYNAATGMYEMYDLAGNLKAINNRIDDLEGSIGGTNTSIKNIQKTLSEYDQRIRNLQEQVSNLTSTVESLTSRLTAIESAIYNWANDKTTKITRGNINVTSGGFTSGKGIYSRTPDQNDDLNFN